MTLTVQGHDKDVVQEERTLNRRAFLISAGKATAMVGVASAAGGLLGSVPAGASDHRHHHRDEHHHDKSGHVTKLKLQQSYINNVEFAGFYVAAKKGFYNKYGLTVDIMSAGATTDPRTVVADGGAQTGVVSETSDTLIGISQGVPYTCIGASFQENPGCLMVLASSNIHSVKDLEGKVIGFQDNARQQVLGILKANSVPTDKVTLQVIGDTPEPLVLGKIDAYTAFAFNEPIALKMKGIQTRCYSFSKIGLPGYGDNIVAANDVIKKEPELLAKFLRATQEGWEYAIKHRHNAVSITLDDYPSTQTATQQKLQMEAQVPMLQSGTTRRHGLLWVNPHVWKEAIKEAESNGALAKHVTVHESLTLEILKRAKHVKHD